MFELCMFDLDDTLVRTEDLKDEREACKNSDAPARLQAVRAGLKSKAGRHIYSLELLEQIRAKNPDLKLGVFTRSPRSYAKVVLKWAYPEFVWDIVVGYEDVIKTKPHGHGIRLAMKEFGVQDLDRVMMVGDSAVDIRAAYNCGCLVTLDATTWPEPKTSENFYALERVADALIDAPEKLLDVLANHERFLPELERLFANAGAPPSDYRFDRINHFVPKAVGADTYYPVYVCGRSFSNKPSLRERRKWHALSLSVEDQKEADEFPEEWIKAIRRFISAKCGPHHLSAKKRSVLVTVVPHRPGRKARLESLLAQLQKSVVAKPILTCEVTVGPELLAYKAGVKSQHNDLLNQHDRFVNVRDHLYVKAPELLKAGSTVLVIDDVCTTGASLIYATKYLQDAGAADVKRLAFAKNIGEVL